MFFIYVMSIFGIKQSTTAVIQNNFYDLEMITRQQMQTTNKQKENKTNKQ